MGISVLWTVVGRALLASGGRRNGNGDRGRLLAAVLGCALLAVGLPAPAHAAGHAPAAAVSAVSAGAVKRPHTVAYDDYSFIVDGKRTYVWSGEFHYYRLPSPDLWRDVLTKMKAAGFNATSLYFSWAYHSSRPGSYDFSGVRDVDKLLSIANELGMYVIARPGPYINAEVDGGGFPGWLTTNPGRARSADPQYLAAADEWLSRIDAILARHQLTNGTGTVLMYQVENEFYDGSAPARQYMAHLEQKARTDGITVPLVGNHNNTFNSGAGALDVDFPDGYPQGFDCSHPSEWAGVGDYSGYKAPGKPLGMMEFQGGAFDPWGGPGYDKCRELTGPAFQKVFYKHNISFGMTLQNFYMTYGGTSWGWQACPSQVYSSYDYGAPISEGRQLNTKYDEDKRIGYFTQAVTPLAKTDALAAPAPTSPAIVDTARINPDDHTQFHVLRHGDSTSTANDTTHVSLDLGARPGYTYDDSDAALRYDGTWTHAGPEESYTQGDYRRTESFSAAAGASVTVPFDGTGVRWISNRYSNHGIADVYLDGAKVSTVDGYGEGKQVQEVFYEARGLTPGAHTLKIVVTGAHRPAAGGDFVAVDAVDVLTGGADTYYPSVPQQPGTAIRFNGRDSKILVANYRLGDANLRYSTSEIMTHARIDGRDVALLYGRDGEDGETVLHYDARPTVTVLSGDVASTWDASRGDLRLNYRHAGLARVLVTGGPRPLLLLLGTDEVAATFWQQQTPQGPVLVRGPALVRTADSAGSVLALTGDATGNTDIEVFAPRGAVTWNGSRVSTRVTSSGSREGRIPGPKPVALPSLTNWKYAPESPEAQPGFDDSRWQVVDKMTTNSSTGVAALPVLYADDYGFHYGDVWYRGRFRATGGETGVSLSAITGRAGVWSVWLNGTFLGSGGEASKTFTFPAGAVRAGTDNVLSVLVQNSGHNEDYGSADTHKEARGLASALFTGAPLNTLTWRIQGNRGGENPIDPVRGPMNNGGLYGERAGWSLPGFPDAKWQNVALPHADATPGITWYRTTAHLNLPTGQDTSIGLRINDAPTRHSRAEIFVNGWQLGRYANDLGPQHSFPIPAGILNPRGDNTVAIAVWNTDASTGGLGTVSLESYGSPTSPLTVTPVKAPGYDRARYAQPAPSRIGLSLNAPGSIQPGQTVTVSALVSVPAGAPTATKVEAGLTMPTGWTAVPTSPVTVSRIPAGHSATVTWQVTAPAKPQEAYVLTATAHARQSGHVVSATDGRVVRSVPVPPSADALLGDMSFLSATNGWGPVERNTSNGEAAAGDGRTLTLNGASFPSGLGVHAASHVSVYLGGRCKQFSAMVGVDDEVGDSGSVTFAVNVDGKTVTTTPVLTGASAALPIQVDVSGAQVVDLVVDDGADGNARDHADWANAMFTCS